MQNDESSVENTATQADGAPIGRPSVLNSEFGGMILIGCAILGCVLVAWGFQRNAKRKIAEQDDELAAVISPRTPARVEVRAVPRQEARAARAVEPRMESRFEPRFEPKPDPRTSRDESLQAGIRNQAELAADVAEIATLRHDLRDLGKKVVGDLDTRLAQLEAAIEHADAVTQRLERTIRAAASVPAPIAPPAAAATPYSTPPAPLAPPRPSSFVESVPTRHAPNMFEPRSARDDTRTIIELAERGVSAKDIAQQVGRPVGQIELIIALRGKGSPVAR